MSSKIEWTEETWNPVVGCDKVSEGCKNCYAIKQAYRLMHMPHGKEKYAGTVKRTDGASMNWTGVLNYDDKWLLKPLQAKKPTRYFVNSMSDLFHVSVPFEFIDKVFAVMAMCSHHTFQILTKRPDRMQEWYNRVKRGETKWANMSVDYDENGNTEMREACRHAYRTVIDNRQWPLPNVWLGVSVENQKAADERIPLLLQVPAAVRWLSMEPLLGPVDIINYVWWDKSLDGIDWVVVGGESGHDARPVHPDWVRSIRDQCKAADVPFFFKQWGAWKAEERPGTEIDLRLLADNQAVSASCIKGHHVLFTKLNKKETGRLLDGVEHNEYPVAQECRQE